MTSYICNNNQCINLDICDRYNNNSEKFISYLGNKKYNLKRFIKNHPGGSIIKKAIGKNMNEVWKKYGVSWHMKNKRVKNVLNNLEIK